MNVPPNVQVIMEELVASRGYPLTEEEIAHFEEFNPILETPGP